MAEQARKVGARIAELRGDRRWKQRDLVDAMAELGDDALNTNQLSRYENGGAMPGEERLLRFAQVLEVEVGDLHAGPRAERNDSAPDLMAELEPIDLNTLRDQLDRIEATQESILGALAGQDAVAAYRDAFQRRQQESPRRPSSKPGARDK